MTKTIKKVLTQINSNRMLIHTYIHTYIHTIGMSKNIRKGVLLFINNISFMFGLRGGKYLIATGDIQ